MYSMYSMYNAHKYGEFRCYGECNTKAESCWSSDRFTRRKAKLLFLLRKISNIT